MGGFLKAIAVAGAKRVPALPNVPTLAESGVPGFESSSWQGWFVPANTPPEVVCDDPAGGRQGAQ